MGKELNSLLVKAEARYREYEKFCEKAQSAYREYTLLTDKIDAMEKEQIKEWNEELHNDLP